MFLGHHRKGGVRRDQRREHRPRAPGPRAADLRGRSVGIGEPSGIAPLRSVPAFLVLVALAIPPMVTNTYVGVAQVDDEARDAARGMGMSGGQLLRRVELPLALPLIMAGIRTSAVAVVATATLAAFVGWGGLGRYIIDGFAVQDDVKLFAGALLVALLAIAVELTLAVVQRHFVSEGLDVRVSVGGDWEQM